MFGIHYKNLDDFNIIGWKYALLSTNLTPPPVEIMMLNKNNRD